MQKYKNLLILTILLLALTACNETLIDTGTSKTLFVAPATAVCESETGPTTCLQIREQGALPWQYSLDGIEGFDYEAGYFYELQVREWADEGPTTDGSGVRYVLETQTNKEPAIVQTVYVALHADGCDAVAEQPCLDMKTDPEVDFQPWPGKIVGFEPQEGYVYELQIAKVEAVDTQVDPPAPWVLLNLVDAQLADARDEEDGATAVASDQPSAGQVADGFKSITVDELGVSAVVPAAWPPITDDPLVQYGWGTGHLTFVAFNAAPGDDVRESMAELVGIESAALVDGSANGEYHEETVNGRLWGIFTQQSDEVNLTQTAAITAADGTVYLVSLFVENPQQETIMPSVLQSFELYTDTEVVAGTSEELSGNATEEAVLGNATATAVNAAVATSVPEATLTPEPQETAVSAPELTLPESATLPFVSRRWFLISLGGVPVIDGSEVTAVFAADRQLSGTGGCNEYFGPYAANEDGALSVGLLAATRLSCEEALMAQENDTLMALETTVAYQFAGTQLAVIGSDGQESLIFASSPPLILQGSPWILAAYVDNDGQLVERLVGSEVTAVFAADGSLTGSAGCNEYSSTYISNRGTLIADLPQATLAICDDPEGIMGQETAYLANLTLVTAYQLSDRHLELLNELGETLLTFEIQNE